jgi:hypothetical protein
MPSEAANWNESRKVLVAARTLHRKAPKNFNRPEGLAILRKDINSFGGPAAD